MRDTYSKLHHDFSLDSNDNDDASQSPIDDTERKRRRSIGLKMLMSRESSYGGGFKSDDTHVLMKSLGDDSIVNQQLAEVN